MVAKRYAPALWRAGYVIKFLNKSTLTLQRAGMKTIVIYRSKTGFTKKYANWIAKAVDATLVEAGKVSAGGLMRYDTIVFGGAMYAGGINGILLIKRNLWRYTSKNIVIFTLGATPVRPEIVDEIRDKNFTPDEQRHIKFFMLRGGFNYQKLGPIDKMLMQILKAKLKRVKHPTADERGMLAAYSRPVDFTDRRLIEPIVEAILKGKDR
jgi:menaquinone-dependent protoporphyrinogen IX oxidase